MIKISAWNIHGLTEWKHDHPDLLNLLNSNDITCLIESWLSKIQCEAIKNKFRENFHVLYTCRRKNKHAKQNSGGVCQLGPRYEGQLTRMAEPIPPSGQSSSYSLTTLSSSSSTDRRAETDRKVITTRIAVAHHFRCRLRRRESCILGATSSQPILPLHELSPARLVIHRQTSAHERRKGTLSVQSRSGILADFCSRQH